ncbi:hypothetical protein GCM10009107_22940 [Ideonella azotifigens]|uniref:Uncharacterized protein n=1 Tax=Ideonella azotifigens TaxID=513160 RepID=A0ABP3V995_9BURK
MLRCRWQAQEYVGLCIGGAGAAELLEFRVEQCVEASGVAAHHRLVQFDFKCLKLAKQRWFEMLHWK